MTFVFVSVSAENVHTGFGRSSLKTCRIIILGYLKFGVVITLRHIVRMIDMIMSVNEASGFYKLKVRSMACITRAGPFSTHKKI